MITAAQQNFLETCATAANGAGHVFPIMAACEASLESSWGASELAKGAHNLFGTKQSLHPEYGTVHLPTREFLKGQWLTVDAAWVVYPDVRTCFLERMNTLRRLAPEYPHYAFAIEAKDAETYITEVSLSWSTDPDRAKKVLQIYHAHAASLRLENV